MVSGSTRLKSAVLSACSLAGFSIFAADKPVAFSPEQPVPYLSAEESLKHFQLPEGLVAITAKSRSLWRVGHRITRLPTSLLLR